MPTSRAMATLAQLRMSLVTTFTAYWAAQRSDGNDARCRRATQRCRSLVLEITLTAISLYSAIATGLYQREKTGKGTRVTTSLIAEGAWAAATWIEGALNHAKILRGCTTGRIHQMRSLNPYPTSDDRWILHCARAAGPVTGQNSSM